MGGSWLQQAAGAGDVRGKWTNGSWVPGPALPQGMGAAAQSPRMAKYSSRIILDRAPGMATTTLNTTLSSTEMQTTPLSPCTGTRRARRAVDHCDLSFGSRRAARANYPVSQATCWASGCMERRLLVRSKSPYDHPSSTRQTTRECEMRARGRHSAVNAHGQDNAPTALRGLTGPQRSITGRLKSSSPNVHGRFVPRCAMALISPFAQASSFAARGGWRGFCRPPQNE